MRKWFTFETGFVIQMGITPLPFAWDTERVAGREWTKDEVQYPRLHQSSIRDELPYEDTVGDRLIC